MIPICSPAGLARYGHIHTEARKGLPYPHFSMPDSYLEEVKSVASAFGYTPEAIDRLAAMGFSAEELEEFLYCGEL